MRTGIFYGFSTGKTQWIAERITKEFGDNIEVNDIETIDPQKMQAYDLIIIGVSTWYAGGLSDYWEEVLPGLKNLRFEGKKIAIFGLGNQKGYPNNFGDAVGILANIFEPLGAELIGFTSTDGYEFNESAAVRNNQFIGLIIDEENQSELTSDRIKNWLVKVKQQALA
jgi:flavodoxin I